MIKLTIYPSRLLPSQPLILLMFTYKLSFTLLFDILLASSLTYVRSNYHAYVSHLFTVRDTSDFIHMTLSLKNPITSSQVFT